MVVNGSLNATFSEWRSLLQADAAEERQELIAARDDLADPAYAAEIDRQIAQVDTRQSQIAAYDGVPVRAFSVVHDPAVVEAISTRFHGQITRGVSALPSSDCDSVQSNSFFPTEQRASRTARASSTSRDTQSERDWDLNSYSPPFIRVRTQLGTQNKVTVAWKYVSSKNFAYWRDPSRRSGWTRGTEVQVDMNQENPKGEGAVFGLPYWYTGRLDPGPAPADIQRPTANVWNANFRCAYPDDYFEDNKTKISLTIGMACRPNKRFHRYRWAHYVVPKDNTDQITVSVTPMHQALDTNTFNGVPETTYCERIVGGVPRRLGSCMFGDYGPPNRKYTTSNGSKDVLTPSNVVFRRWKDQQR